MSQIQSNWNTVRTSRALLGATLVLSIGAGLALAEPPTPPPSTGSLDGFEYLVVGSGAGGGPLAARLARAGHKVLLLEAGQDHGNSTNYRVPAFHPFASEDPAMSWNFFVKHYDDQEQQKKDSKHRMIPDANGAQAKILYPRCATLGGCTAHNAMVTQAPHDSYWNDIARITGDQSWAADNMWKYMERLERNHYLGDRADHRRHGRNGWLSTELADASAAIKDTRLGRVIFGAVLALAENSTSNPLSEFVYSLTALANVLRGDMNAFRVTHGSAEGVFPIPLATDHGARNGPREWLLQTAKECPQYLKIVTGVLVSRVLLEPQGNGGPLRATGVAIIQGDHLYRADPGAAASSNHGPETEIHVSREVIVSGGAFNSPQLLKLSGIGPKAELEKFGITVRVELPGVGTNLQDHYEVAVVSKTQSDFSALRDATFGANPNDPEMERWRQGRGLYTSNGVLVGVPVRSSKQEPDPDLFLFCGVGFFKGYEPGYSARLAQDKRHITWAILKAHTGNSAGNVALRSADPLDTPEITFRYYQEGTNANGEGDKDLNAMCTGVQLTRRASRWTARLLHPLSFDPASHFQEEIPGAAVNTPEAVSTFVKNESWGHHASCTCRIGPDSGDPMAVLDSRFRVRNVAGLRVVDASIFPKVPGFFPVLPTYMISEKAADVILEAAK